MNDILNVDNTIEYSDDIDSVGADRQEINENSLTIDNDDTSNYVGYVVTVSENDIVSVDDIESIKEDIEEIKENDIRTVQELQSWRVYLSDVSSDVSDNQTIDIDDVEIVSINNIMNTPISDYTVSESLNLMLFVSVLIGGFVYVIKRSIYKWS